jgi:hypothetical protein
MQVGLVGVAALGGDPGRRAASGEKVRGVVEAHQLTAAPTPGSSAASAAVRTLLDPDA